MYQTGEIISNRCLKGDYYQVLFYAPEIAAKAVPGQFVHVQIANMSAHILRRPFSINAMEPRSSEDLAAMPRSSIFSLDIFAAILGLEKDLSSLGMAQNPIFSILAS